MLNCVEISERVLVAAKSRFQLILIKPSHYDDEGYVIRHFRGVLPSNTLAYLSSLTLDVAQSKELGEDYEIEVALYDDTVEKILEIDMNS